MLKYHDAIDPIHAMPSIDVHQRIWYLIVPYIDISITESTSHTPLGKNQLGENVVWSKVKHKVDTDFDDDGISGEYRTIMTHGKKNDTEPDIQFSDEFLEDRFHLILSSYLASQEVTRSNQTATVVKPNGLKFSVEIHNFPYKYDNSSLAVIAQVESKDKRTTNVDGNPDKMTIGEGLGRFGWVPEVNIGDNEVAKIDVERVTVDIEYIRSKLFDNIFEEDDDGDENETVDLMIFKIDAIQPAHIVWDPEVGVDDKLIRTTVENSVDKGLDDKKNSSNSVTTLLSLTLLSLIVCSSLISMI